MESNEHKRSKRAAEIVLGIGTLDWIIRLGRGVLEAVSDAQTVATIARHSAQIGQAIVTGAGWFFTPIGSGLAIVISGGYLWIDNRRQKSAKPVSAPEQQLPQLLVATPTPDLPALAVNAEPAPRIVQQAPEERIFIDVPPHELVAPFGTQVEPQAERAVARYIGKWYGATSSVTQIRRYSNDWIVTLFVEHPAKPFFATQIALRFDSSWTKRIELLDRGSTVTAIGKIERIGDRLIALTDCSFVS